MCHSDGEAPCCSSPPPSPLAHQPTPAPYPANRRAFCAGTLHSILALPPSRTRASHPTKPALRWRPRVSWCSYCCSCSCPYSCSATQPGLGLKRCPRAGRALFVRVRTYRFRCIRRARESQLHNVAEGCWLGARAGHDALDGFEGSVDCC